MSRRRGALLGDQAGGTKEGRERRGGLTTPQFVRAGLMRLEMGEDLPHIIRGRRVRQIASVEEVLALQSAMKA